MKEIKRVLTRREFTKRSMVAAGIGSLPIFHPKAILAEDSKKVFKVGLIGCGGRGNGALEQHVAAAKILNKALGWNLEIQVVGTADWFKDRAEGAGSQYGVPKEKCFGGPDAYRKLLEIGMDIVLMATPPAFRPPHFEAAVKAGRHVFMEKPVAVDPPGCRKIIEAGEEAKKKGLMVVAGTQRRHEKGYIETQAAVAEGAIGKIMGGRVAWCMAHMFARNPIEPKSMDQVVGGWQDWVPLSGDHIVEQHVHNLDVMNWFLGTHPTSARGFGGRARRNAGNQYDFFSVDFEFPEGVHIHSMCRQVDGCWDWVGEHLIATNGQTGCGGGLTPKNPIVPAEIPQEGGGHQQEHINMLYYLVKGKELNEARNVACSTATAVMGRQAAYSGVEISWRDMMEDPNANPELYNLTLKPTAEDFEKGTAEIPEENAIPRAGRGGESSGRPRRKRQQQQKQQQ